MIHILSTLKFRFGIQRNTIKRNRKMTENIRTDIFEVKYEIVSSEYKIIY